MRKILFALAMMISIQTWSQPAYEVTKDEQTGHKVYRGAITAKDLGDFTWFTEANYTPAPASVDYLKTHLPKYKMVIFLGTWCEDSHIVVPRLFEVMRQVNYPEANYILYGADREKTTPGNEHKTYNVKFVPTIILLNGDKEIGRIVEMPQESVEAHLADIIAKYEEKK